MPRVSGSECMGKWGPEDDQCGSGNERKWGFYVRLVWKKNARTVTLGPC